MKGKGGPDRSLYAVMMHLVKVLVYFGDVHPAMYPVVIGILNEQDQKYAQGYVPHRKQIQILVDRSKAPVPQPIGANTKKSKYQGADQGIVDLGTDLSAGYRFVIEYPGIKSFFKQNEGGVVIEAGKNKVANSDDQEQYENECCNGGNIKLYRLHEF